MRYSVERSALVLSVGELCREAILPTDLDLRPGHGSGRSPIRAAEGRELHKLLQARAEEGCEAEVPVSNTTLYDGICYEVSGRIDGMFRRDGKILLEEIKTVTAKAFERPPSQFHEAQAMCYAYFLSEQYQTPEITVRLTLARREDCKTKYFQRVCSQEELKAFYLELLSRIAFRAAFLMERETVRRPALHHIRFPYPSVRNGQEIMVKECHRDIKAGKRLFLQAPTGIGKTVSALYPSIRALGEGYCDRIFYLTAKAATGREAYRAAAKMFSVGAKLKTVVLTSREQICVNPSAVSDPGGITGHCNPMDCPRAKNFYANCSKAIAGLLETQNGFPRTSVEAAAEKYCICPYELQLMLAEYCDIIICDYNYVFDPLVYLRRFFDSDALDESKNVFLIDEAHNLSDRTCGMYSANLNSSDVVHFYRKLLQLKDDALTRRFSTVEALLSELKGLRRLCRDNLTVDSEGKEHGYYLTKNPMLTFAETVNACYVTLEQFLFRQKDHPLRADLVCLSGVLKRFVTVSEAYDSRFLTFAELHGKEVTVRLICLDPSDILDHLLNRAKAAVLFSATLTPTDYFADILGGGRKAVKISLPSPFKPSQFCLAAATHIHTRYEERKQSVKKISSVIAAMASGKKGNYIVYFPSYDYMEQVQKYFSERYASVLTVAQKKRMSPAEKEAFLETFADDGKLRVGFCVLGGSFSEGVDLPGGRLIGVGIVGVGLPGISNQRNILKEYYDSTRERGYDYAYTYPGMNRVLQAAGRVIRRETDRGVIVLMDDRYADERYKMLFPDHWSDIQYAGNALELANIISEFWKKSSE